MLGHAISLAISSRSRSVFRCEVRWHIYRLTEVIPLDPEKDVVIGRSRLYQKARDGR